LAKFEIKLKMKKLFIAVSIISVLSSCGNSENEVQSQDGEVSSSIAAGGESEEELKASLADAQKEEEESIASSTSMSFDKMLHDFGKIKVDTDNKATFVVTNTGKNPLIIDKVDVSCGCTTAEKPEKPILPGKSDKISVVFHPKPGQLNEQKKTITVTANTEPKIVVLDIQAFVNE
jgi:archaellum component FlaG (FlaF/FlaG flagellin family)